MAVILVVLSSGLAAFFLLNKPSGQLIAQPIVGHAFFISSGQIGETSNQGIMDELQVELANVPNPASGKSYYGWLEQEQTFTQTPTVAPLLLGKLPVTNGSISFHYTDPQHSNLLATRSIFLITEEDAGVQPIAPIDHSTWRYGAQLLSLPFRLGMRLPGTPPPTLRPGTRFITSMTRLRYLLAQAPPLQPDQPGQPGGLDIWLFRNAEKILEWSVSARDDWQTGSFLSLHRHLVRILDYLDGLPFVQQDAAGEPVYVTAANAQVGLLNVNPSGDSSGDPTKLGFLYMIDDHLNALIQSTASTPYQRGLATQIDQTVKQVRAWLTNVRKDAQQLERMSSAQLAQTSTRDSLLDAMSNDALAAFAGQIDPATGNVEKGVIQIHYDIQRLATFDLHAASGPCSVDDLFYSQCRPTP